jgi:MFS family permease
MSESTANHPPHFRSSVRALWRNGPFTRYISGEAISMTGTWMQAMAQGWVMTGLTDKAVMLGMVNFAAGIPMIALSMVGGTVADRYPKRNILLLTQVLQIACAASLGWLVATGQIRIWHIIGVAFFLGIAAAFEMPSAAALVPELVGKEHIAAAIGIDRAVFHGTRLLGPALAGYAIAWLGTASAFYANALSFVAFMVALYTIHPHPAPTTAEGQRGGGIREGFNYVRQDRPTLAMIGLLAANVVFVFPMMAVMMPLYARHVLGLGPDKMGLLMGCTAIGGLTGSIGMIGVPRDKRRAVLFAAVTVVAVAMCGLASAHQFTMAAGSAAVLALGATTLFGLANTTVQERAPSPMRGRVSAIVGLGFFGLMPFAGLGLTSVADAIGFRRALVGAAIAYLVVTVAVLLGIGRPLKEPAATG